MQLGAAILALVVICCAIEAPRLASAQEPSAAAPQPTILVVDYRQVLQDAAATQTVQAALDSVRATYQEEFLALEQELRQIEQRLMEDRGTLGPEQMAERRAEFEQRVAEAQSEARNRLIALDRAQARAMEQVQAVLLDVIAEIAEERGANIVLGKSQIVLVDSVLDVSVEALRRLDERLPSVDVTVPTE